MAVQPGLCGTWSETPKTGFLTTRIPASHLGVTVLLGLLLTIETGISLIIIVNYRLLFQFNISAQDCGYIAKAMIIKHGLFSVAIILSTIIVTLLCLAGIILQGKS